MTFQILEGDCREVLATLPEKSVQCCVTSPPYFGLRDYGVVGQLGLESTPDEYVEKMVAVFREVRRVLKDDGTLWLNIGDSYWGSGQGWGDTKTTNKGHNGSRERNKPEWADCGLKAKDLIGIPWMLAFALRADGWYLRQDIIWSKPNPMPESVTDRCTKAHEYIFLLSKSARYYFDAEAIAEGLAPSSVECLSQVNIEQQAGSGRVPGKTNGAMKAVSKYREANGNLRVGFETKGGTSADLDGTLLRMGEKGTRNKRSVWTVTTQPYSGAHFATFPPKLIEPCILAGSRKGDTVLDPFNGAGTTGLVSDRLGRDYIGIELNPAYAEMSRRRITDDAPLFVDGAA